MGQLISWDTVQRLKSLGDSFSNFLSGINTVKSKGANQTPVMSLLTRLDQENLYRGDWISRKIIDIPAFDMTRAWRSWEADPEQIEALEAAEKAFGIQRKMMSAMAKARLYGGAALVMGIEGQKFNEELDVETVMKDSLAFVHVVSKWDIAAGPIIRDVGSPYFGEPSYYERTNIDNAANPGNVNVYGPKPLAGVVPGQVLYIHPSRVVRLIGMEYPNIESAQDPWGDSVLQPLYEAIRDLGLVTSSIAEAIAELKIDIIKVQGLSSLMSTNEGSAQLIRRFSNANAAKSVVNTLMLDETETYERHTLAAAGLEKIIETFGLLCSGGGDIPATRLFGQSPAGMNATGDSDVRNYYDRLHAELKTKVEPLLNRLDEVMIRSALGSRPDEIHYEWNPLWQMDDTQKAAIAYQKAQAHQIDVNLGLINPEVLREGRINQLIEDGFYPGFEGAIDEYGSEPDEDDINEKAANAAAAVTGATAEAQSKFDPKNPAENSNAKPGAKKPEAE